MIRSLSLVPQASITGCRNRLVRSALSVASVVWVGDQGNHRVQEFNQAGEYVTQFGSFGSGEGQFSFAYPMGIASDSSGALWVTDVSNHRLQKWVP
jgi:streptogramin lyase